MSVRYTWRKVKADRWSDRKEWALSRSGREVGRVVEIGRGHFYCHTMNRPKEVPLLNTAHSPTDEATARLTLLNHIKAHWPEEAP